MRRFGRDLGHILRSVLLIEMTHRSDEMNMRGPSGVWGRLAWKAPTAPLVQPAIRSREIEEREFCICEPDPNGRILKSDYYGRSFRVLPFRRPQSGVRRLSVLSELKVGESGVLVALDLPESVQNHLMHMGFVPDALVTVLRRAPAGDPTVYGVDGMEIALRRETAAAIRMQAPKPRSRQRNSEAVADEDVPELVEAAQ